MEKNFSDSHDGVSHSNGVCTRPEKRRARFIRRGGCCAADSGSRVGRRDDLGFPEWLAPGVVGKDHEARELNRLVPNLHRRKEMVALVKLKKLIADIGGDAIVEATILFPIMIMIFAAFVLLAMYLPQRTILQEAAQYTAVALATENSDTYIAFDDEGNRVERNRTDSVYVAAVQGILGSDMNAEAKAYSIANHLAGGGILSAPGEVSVELETTNYVIYQEITVRLSQSVPMPVNLSFIGFPTEIQLMQEASAVVQNGDEFVRNIDIAKDMVLWLDSKLGISKSLRESGALNKIGEVIHFFGFGGQ